jgi:hypothetical protein
MNFLAFVFSTFQLPVENFTDRLGVTCGWRCKYGVIFVKERWAALK